MNPASTLVLLDTDIGTNIDDALGLSYLLCQARCRLLGVTTVGSESARRADLARALCAAWGRDRVVVLAGFEPPGSLPDRIGDPWPASLPEVERSSRNADPPQAISFLADTIRDHPGQVSLVTIGPLTNVARLLDEYPQAAADLHGVVSMCGLYAEPPPGYSLVETNVGLDPAAAARVLQARLPQHHILGLEVTGAFEIRSDQLLGRLGAATPPLLHTLVDAWAAHREVVRFHDPLAAASLFAPELFTFRPARCTVQPAPAKQLGRTNAEHTGADLPHQLLRAADYQRLAQHLFDTIG